MKQNLKIADIRIDGGTQSRVSINTDAVADYAQALTDGVNLPPVLVFFDGVDHWLADGFHRLHANRKIGAVHIEAEVKSGTLQDAKLHAYGANQGHGLRRSNEDKRKAVQGMLADFADWSDSRIAKHVGVDHKTVGTHRAAILGNSQDAPAVRTVERAGKTYQQDVSAIGKTPTDEKPQSAPPKAAAVAEPEDGGPSAAEIAEARRSAEDDAEAVRLLLESDDKLAAMTDKCKQQAALIRTLEERIRGLTNEAAQAIRLAKSWRTKCEKLEKAAA